MDAFNNSKKSNIQNIGETPMKCIKHMVFKLSWMATSENKVKSFNLGNITQPL